MFGNIQILCISRRHDMMIYIVKYFTRAEKKEEKKINYKKPPHICRF